MSELVETTMYIVYTNSDLTEGRGWEHPLYYTESMSTAMRLGRKKYVQGSDCPIYEKKVYKSGNTYYAPVKLEPATVEDRKQDELRKLRFAALEKAAAAGLTEEEIRLLSL